MRDSLTNYSLLGQNTNRLEDRRYLELCSVGLWNSRTHQYINVLDLLSCEPISNYCSTSLIP